MKITIPKNNNKLFYTILVLLILFLLNKTSFIKNFINITKNNENKRVVRLYGFCGNESVGYLKYLKKKYNIKSNPKIINYIHTPQNNWSIYETSSQNIDSQKMILLNYPGKEINIGLSHFKNNFYELIKPDFYQIISNSIKSLKIQNFEKSNINISFYIKNELNIFKKLKTLNIQKEEGTDNFIINQIFDDLDMNDNRVFIKIDDLKKTYNLSIKLDNKYDITNYKILDQYKNCYFVK